MNTQHMPEETIFEEARHRYAVASNTVSNTARQFDEKFRAVCREHPWAVLAGAVVAGFAVGRFITRR